MPIHVSVQLPRKVRARPPSRLPYVHSQGDIRGRTVDKASLHSLSRTLTCSLDIDETGRELAEQESGVMMLR